MSYKTRSARRIVKKSKRNFIVTLIIIGFLLFATLNWILPNFISGVGSVNDFFHPSKKATSVTDEGVLSAPVLNIPYEATNSSEVTINGFATPNSKVKLYLDDEEKQTTEVSDSGTFTFENIPLSLGTNNIYAKSLGENDKTSLPSKSFEIIFNNEKPSLSVNQPEDNKKIQGGDKKVTISGKTSVGIKILINDSQIIVDKDGNFSTDLQINEGDNNVNIKAIDSAGNSTEIQRKVNYTP